MFMPLEHDGLSRGDLKRPDNWETIQDGDGTTQETVGLNEGFSRCWTHKRALEHQSAS